MKYIYITILTVLYSCYTFSQVGINTVSPQGVFHIDSKGNNTQVLPAADLLDDLVVSDIGNVGVGTMASATNKLLINGNLQINDGTAGEDRILRSDANGISTWVSLDMGSQSVIWYINNNPFTFNGTEQNIVGTTNNVLEVNDIGVVNHGDGTITVPAGQYLMTFNGDIGGYEWGVNRIRTAAGVLIKEYANRNWLTGIGEYIEFTQNTRIRITYQAEKLTGNVPSFYLNATTPFTVQIYYRLSFLKLNI